HKRRVFVRSRSTGRSGSPKSGCLACDAATTRSAAQRCQKSCGRWRRSRVAVAITGHRTVLTSQRPPAPWHEHIGDATLADAICDRLLHNAHRLVLKGPSRRKETKLDS